ncbi:MAG: hypothetical protein ACHQ4G_12210 [Opitutales bacterium]
MKPVRKGPDGRETTRPAFGCDWKHRLKRLTTYSLRDVWWWGQDIWEKHRTLRRAVYFGLGLLAVGAVLRLGVYPWWTRMNSVRMARQWVEAGKFREAGPAIQQAMEFAPNQAEVWHLAASYARYFNDPRRALGYSRDAANLAPDNTDYVLTWASDALLADQPDIAAKALGKLSGEVVNHSAWAQRIAGELARRNQQPAEARRHFARAVALGGPRAENEVPLGLVLLADGKEGGRRRGTELLQSWAHDSEWGAIALRALLADALQHHDREAMLRWAEQLRAHPRCSLGDLPLCLQGLAEADPPRFRQVLAEMEQAHAARATDAALLIGWLNQIGQSREAIRWAHTLPDAMIRNLPVAPVVAEALRQLADWPELQAWTKEGPWGANMDLIRLGYGLLAAQLGNDPRQAAELWKSIESRAAENGGRTLFAGDTFYSWGLVDQAVTLLWSAANQMGSSHKALGTLVRHYQLKGDAEGLYRAYRQLHNLREDDALIANNFAFFAALTGNAPREAREIAQRNFHADPSNQHFRATLAFVLYIERHYAQGLKVLHPVAGEWTQSPALTFAYGLNLAGSGQKAEARQILNTLDPHTLTRREIDLILAALQ